MQEQLARIVRPLQSVLKVLGLAVGFLGVYVVLVLIFYALFAGALQFFAALPRLIEWAKTDFTLTGLFRDVFPLSDALRPWVIGFIDAFILFNFVALSVMVIIYALRKIVGFIQARLGPRYVGPRGILQTLADAIKLLTKEDTVPVTADYAVFLCAPIIAFLPAFLVYVTIPLGDPKHFQVRDLNIGVLYLIAITGMNVIALVMAGWASGNKWSILGGMRSAAQLVSYEVPMTLALAVPALLAGTLSLRQIVQDQEGSMLNWFIFGGPEKTSVWALLLLAAGFIAAIVYFICALAETNQTPFDLPEADSELVAGFNVEYSGMKFALFFLAEFANTLTISIIATILFLGGWHAPTEFKILVMVPAVLVPLFARAKASEFWLLFPLPNWLGEGWLQPANKSFILPLWWVPITLPAWAAKGLAVWFGLVAALLFWLIPDRGWGTVFWLLVKAGALNFTIMWVRATLPRLRVDQIMELGWKVLIPVALLSIMFAAIPLAVTK